jgi:hypothetical protein
VTYNVQVITGDKNYIVTVVFKNNKSEVIAVRSTTDISPI